nr:reverse transcriptase [Tanacetum cinerariifolium]
MSPYQALYGKVLLSIIPYPPGSSKVAAVEDVLVERDELLHQLRDNLLAGKNRMEENANLKRCKWSLMWVISKIHPVFHVSILKPFLGSGSEAVAEILGESDEGFMVEQPLAVCGSLFVLRDGSLIK